MMFARGTVFNPQGRSKSVGTIGRIPGGSRGRLGAGHSQPGNC